MIDQMKTRVALLNEASRAYYKDSREIITNLEYDRLYDELLALENETGIVLSGSPTGRVGDEVLSSLPKERHAQRMLSLDKTKDPEALALWLGDREGLLSWKLDGLTIVLTYREGKLFKAVTRGNGEVGEVITSNARVFANLPVRIPFRGELVIRGEAVIPYSTFDRINRELPDLDAQYKNPRNLASGTVRQLSSRQTADRGVCFFAFALVLAEGMEFLRRSEQLLSLSEMGFETVSARIVDKGNLKESISDFEAEIPGNDLPSDGLVLIYDEIAYGKSLGSTSKFPRDAMAFKWRDEIAKTHLIRIEWSPSRTGLINPIAVFEPVELEGTTVSRASIHNVSILKELKLGVGDEITVYKANMIIPQVAENLTQSGPSEIPDTCPVCSGKAVIREDNGIQTLYCTNPDCPAKQIKSFTHFAARDAMDIEGLSGATIEKFVDSGFLKNPSDFFRLEQYREEITGMEGFGEKSFDNLMQAIEKARHTTAAKLLYSLGIPGIGLANARLIAGQHGSRFTDLMALTREELSGIDGIGPVMAEAFVKYFNNQTNLETVRDLLGEVTIEATEQTDRQDLAGMTFVITGSLSQFENRDALREAIEARGGKVSSSVSAKTSFLINNDSASGSTKNKNARSLGVPILTEQEFIQRYLHS